MSTPHHFYVTIQSKPLFVLPRNSNSLFSWSLNLCHPYFRFPSPPQKAINIATKFIRAKQSRKEWRHSLLSQNPGSRSRTALSPRATLESIQFQATHGYKVKPCLKTQTDKKCKVMAHTVILSPGGQTEETRVPGQPELHSE